MVNEWCCFLICVFFIWNITSSAIYAYRMNQFNMKSCKDGCYFWDCKKSYDVTIQMKRLGQYFHMVLFVLSIFTKWNLEMLCNFFLATHV